MSLEDTIADLVTATTDLTEAVNVKKVTLDDAVATANTAKNEAQTAAGLAQEARDGAEQAEADVVALDNAYRAVFGTIGYQVPVAYTSGIELTQATQTVEYDGNTYAPVMAELPFTTSGTFEVDKFRLIQGISSTDLAAPGGAALVGQGVMAVNTIADLLALPAGQRKADMRYLVKEYHAGTGFGGGEFYYDSSRVGENDGGCVLHGFIRITDRYSVSMFGARGDGVSDDHAAITAAMTYVSSIGGGELLFNQGFYQVTDTVQVPSYVVLVGVGMSDNDSHPTSQIRGMGIGGPLAGPVVAFGQGKNATGVKAPGMRNMTVGGQSACAVKVDNASPVNLENIKLRGAHTDGFSFANTWSSSFRNLHTNGCTIPNACFRTGEAFNANVCENWYTSNRSQVSILIDSPRSHGNNFVMMCCQGSRYGLWVALSGYSGWNFDTVYFENVAHPIRLGDRANNKLARNVIITTPTLMSSPDQWNEWAHEVDAAIDFDYANSCIVDMPLYMATSTGSQVTITGDGSGAKAYAIIGSDGIIRGVGVVQGGAGYTTATLTFPASGSGAAGEAVIVDGVITDVVLSSGGEGYVQPTGLPLELIYNLASNCTVRGGSRLIGNTVQATGSEAFIGRRSSATGSSGVHVESILLSLNSVGAWGSARIFKSSSFNSRHFIESTDGNGERILRSFQPIIFDRITTD